jgi:hypothetical protein
MSFYIILVDWFGEGWMKVPVTVAKFLELCDEYEIHRPVLVPFSYGSERYYDISNGRRILAIYEPQSAGRKGVDTCPE